MRRDVTDAQALAPLAALVVVGLLLGATAACVLIGWPNPAGVFGGATIATAVLGVITTGSLLLRLRDRSADDGAGVQDPPGDQP